METTTESVAASIHKCRNETDAFLSSLQASDDESQWMNKLNDIEIKLGSSCWEIFHILKVMILRIQEISVLKNLMQVIIRKMSDLITERKILESKSLATEPLSLLKDSWGLCCNQHKTITGQLFANYSTEYYFVLPSLASIYIDLFVAANRSKEKTELLAKRLYGWLKFELNERCFKTALLEVSGYNKQTAKFLLPLLKEVLLSPPPKKSYLDYLLHFIVLQRWALVLDDFDDVVKVNLNIKAPNKFSEWLTQRWPQGSEHVPQDKSLKGRRVSELLCSLDGEAVESLIDVFSQCLLKSDDFDAERTVGNLENTVDELFVIDKTGNEEEDEQIPPQKKRKVERNSEKDISTSPTKDAVQENGTTRKNNKKKLNISEHHENGDSVLGFVFDRKASKGLGQADQDDEENNVVEDMEVDDKDNEERGSKIVEDSSDEDEDSDVQVKDVKKRIKEKQEKKKSVDQAVEEENDDSSDNEDEDEDGSDNEGQIEGEDEDSEEDEGEMDEDGDNSDEDGRADSESGNDEDFNVDSENEAGEIDDEEDDVDSEDEVGETDDEDESETEAKKASQKDGVVNVHQDRGNEEEKNKKQEKTEGTRRKSLKGSSESAELVLTSKRDPALGYFVNTSDSKDSMDAEEPQIQVIDATEDQTANIDRKKNKSPIPAQLQSTDENSTKIKRKSSDNEKQKTEERGTNVEEKKRLLKPKRVSRSDKSLSESSEVNRSTEETKELTSPSTGRSKSGSGSDMEQDKVATPYFHKPAAPSSSVVDSRKVAMRQSKRIRSESESLHNKQGSDQVSKPESHRRLRTTSESYADLTKLKSRQTVDGFKSNSGSQRQSDNIKGNIIIKEISSKEMSEGQIVAALSNIRKSISTPEAVTHVRSTRLRKKSDGSDKGLGDSLTAIEENNTESVKLKESNKRGSIRTEGIKDQRSPKVLTRTRRSKTSVKEKEESTDNESNTPLKNWLIGKKIEIHSSDSSPSGSSIVPHGRLGAAAFFESGEETEEGKESSTQNRKVKSGANSSSDGELNFNQTAAKRTYASKRRSSPKRILIETKMGPPGDRQPKKEDNGKKQTEQNAGMEKSPERKKSPPKTRKRKYFLRGTSPVQSPTSEDAQDVAVSASPMSTSAAAKKDSGKSPNDRRKSLRSARTAKK